MMNIPDIYELLGLIKAGLISFWDTNYELVKFDSLGLALGAGLFLILCLLYKLLWGRNKYRHTGSGHNIAERYRQGKIRKLFPVIPKIILAFSVLFLLIGLAKPYLPKTKFEMKVKSREMLYLIDESSSRGWMFLNDGTTSGQIGREAMLRFLKMREGQNDKAALLLFARGTYIWQDFIIADDIFMMQVEDAPYIIIYPEHDILKENDPQDKVCDLFAPRDRVMFSSNEGATNLNGALGAVIKYLEENGDKRIKERALIIETDAAVEEDPEKYLKELHDKNIRVYLLHIKPNEFCETRYRDFDVYKTAQMLQDRVKQFGGKTYDIQDSKSLEIAYRDINRLETAPGNKTIHMLKVLIFQRPLMVAFVLFVLSLCTALIIHRFFAENP